MINTIPCRRAFTQKIQQLAELDRNIMVVTSDARGSVTLDEFAKALPDQFVEVGIAEQNEVGIAAGLANFGKTVFVCAPACFLSTRSLEQVKVDVIYSGSNVKIIGVSGGVSYGALGFSHQSLHDVAVMRTFPEMVVLIPSDRFQTEAMTQWMANTEKPVFMRMGRSATPDIYDSAESSFTFGKANVLHQGEDVTIIATGELVIKAIEAVQLLKSRGIKVRLLDMHTIKPIDHDAIVRAATETKAILTIEEHSIYGGLGGAVSEIVVQTNPVPMKILGIPNEIPVTGSAQDVFRHYKLTSEGIAEEVELLLVRAK